jgi:hypothetical protein
MIEENIKALFDEHIQNTRRVSDLVDKFYVFDNQIETAKEIIYNFYTTEKNRWNLLFAEMQSGKSGTFFSIPYIISRNNVLVKKLGIDMFESQINVFLLTGMNEKELISQFEKDIDGFTGMDITKNVLHNSEMRKFLSKPEDTWNTSDKTVINRMRKNSLILIDESHYGSDKDQILDKFLKKILKINPNGDNQPLEENNIYVVSISATPMAEFINANLSDFKKKIIPLKNSNGYYGITSMFNNNKVFESYDLKDNFSVDSFLDRILNNKKNGYILVRCNIKQQHLIKRRIGERMITELAKPIEYNQWSKSNILDNQGINEILYDIPDKKTIIFLKGLLRAGKRVDTKNIIMVHDTSISNVDTTVQSLLGRCCGYGKNQDIEIYCDKFSAEKYKKWIESGYDLKLVPDKSKNILSGGKKNSNNEFLPKIHTLHDPIEFKSNDTIDRLMTTRKSKIDKINILKSLNNETINKILDSGSFDKEYTIGSIFNVDKKKKNTSYKKQYSDVLNNKIFMGDYKPNKNDEGKIVFSAAYEKNDKTILVSFGKVIKPSGVLTSEKSMYHETNKLKEISEV